MQRWVRCKKKDRKRYAVRIQYGLDRRCLCRSSYRALSKFLSHLFVVFIPPSFASCHSLFTHQGCFSFCQHVSPYFPHLHLFLSSSQWGCEWEVWGRHARTLKLEPQKWELLALKASSWLSDAVLHSWISHQIAVHKSSSLTGFQNTWKPYLVWHNNECIHWCC